MTDDKYMRIIAKAVGNCCLDETSPCQYHEGFVDGLNAMWSHADPAGWSASTKPGTLWDHLN